ncbi:hypothetical protein CVT24_008686 [Panaeolus cyanescens]|uniref:Uncharacterized protein n=1 Tax=Panaeolus cyanescens TaxID=181874 RepID=A0A409VKR9_9AGAR|nr:hypothetical protein CVT24_008686 [Panaeolus cyanescens]
MLPAQHKNTGLGRTCDTIRELENPSSTQSRIPGSSQRSGLPFSSFICLLQAAGHTPLVITVITQPRRFLFYGQADENGGPSVVPTTSFTSQQKDLLPQHASSCDASRIAHSDVDLWDNLWEDTSSKIHKLLAVYPFLLPVPSFVPLLSAVSSSTSTTPSTSQSLPDASHPPIPDPDTELATPTWENLRPGEHCLRYATREYTARLANAPPGAEGFRACKTTPVIIHGREMLPTFCQDLGFGRGVWGFWSVDFDEPGCQTKWGRFMDLGCEDSLVDSDETPPVRRMESKLKNLQPGSNWQIMCVTTPADIAGQHFATPAQCMNAGKNGVFGFWEIQDTACES